jgi:hypothetical protein
MIACPPVKSKAFRALVAHLGSKEAAYAAWESNNFEVPTIEQLTKKNVVETPTRDRPKFQSVIDNLIQKKQGLNDQLGNKILELKKDTGENQLTLQKTINSLKRQIDETDENIEKIGTMSSVESILEHANSQLKDISNRMSKDSITENDMLYAKNTIELWREAGDFENKNIFFNDEELEASENPDSDLYKIRKDFVLLRDYAGQLSKTWTKIRTNYLNQWMETNYGKNFKVSVEDVLKDIGLGKAYLLGISKNDYPLIQAMYDQAARANLQTSQEGYKVMKGIGEIFEKIGKRLKKTDIHEMFSQNQSNEDKRKTGNLVVRFTQKYFDDRREANDVLHYNLKKAYSIEDPTKRKAFISEQWKEFNDKTKNNNIILDVRKLFQDKTLYDKEYSPSEVEAHKQELIKTLGQKGYERHLENAEYKIKKYKLAREAELMDLQMNNPEDEAKVNSEIQTWDYENSPYHHAQQWEEGFKQVVNGKYIKANGYNSEIVPRRIVDGKDTGFYDKKYERIESDNELLALHDYLIDTIRELNGYFPADIQGELQVNTLMNLPKGILQHFTGGEMQEGVKGIWDMLKTLQRENIGSEIEDSSTTDVHGNKIKGLNTHWLQPDNKRIKDYVERQEIIYKQSHPVGDSSEAAQLYKLRKEWEKDIKNVIAEENIPDLEKIMKTYSVAALSYKHKAKIEDAMGVAHSFIKDLVASRQNLSGEDMKDQFGNFKTNKKGAENLLNQMDHFMSTFYGEKTQKVELVTKQKVYTNEELKIKKEIEDTLEKGGLSPEDEAKLKKQLDDLGGYRTGGKILDMMNQYVRLIGLSWNPFAAINNASIGYMCNITEGAADRVYSTEQLHRGYWETLHNSKKTNTIMEKNAILEEIQSEINEKNKSTKWFEPFGLQHKTELFNQSPVMVATMLNQKVELDGKEVTMYDAYDNEGNLKPGVKFKDEFQEYRTIQLIKQTIEDIHGNYNPDDPIMANKVVVGRSLLVFRKWMINAFYNRLGDEHYNMAKGMTDKGRWLSYGSYFKEYGALVGTRDIALNLLKKLSFGLVKTNFNERLNEVDAANMRKNMTEIMFLGVVTALALMLKATSDDDEDKVKYLCFFWINQLTRVQTDMLFYTDPQQFKTILRDPLPLMVLVTNAENAVSKSINLIAGGNDIYPSGPHKGQRESLVAIKKIAPAVTLIDRFNSMSQQIFNKGPLLNSVGNDDKNK